MNPTSLVMIFEHTGNEICVECQKEWIGLK
ncbi:MAG: hypothetical protein RI996_212 [Candidatus Parcubacteria bacterium]|jgi:hypothetical protein